MTSMWASFVHDGNPNNHGVLDAEEWPVYDNGVGGYGQDFVFDTNVSSHAEPDTFRYVARFTSLRSVLTNRSSGVPP